MATLLKLRLGVSDDPTALPPNLNDCLAAMLQHAELLMGEVLTGLVKAAGSASGKRSAVFQQESVQQTLGHLMARSKTVCVTDKTELSRIVYEGGGKDQPHGEVLRYEDLQLFDDSALDQSIEVARAQQEVSLSVDDVLPEIDALISTLLGWRTVQSGLNPLRPDVFVRALQSCLAEHVSHDAAREALIAPAAGLLGVNLRRLYRELTDWLKSCGIEPAVPVGGRLYKGGGASGKQAVDSVAKTMLTLDRLRHLLAGDFDQPKINDHLYTVPASMAMLQDMKQVDALVQRLEKRPKPEAAIDPESMAMSLMASEDGAASPRLGTQLGHEVVRLLFDNLAQDKRLMAEFKHQLRAMQPAVFTLAAHDSRFFSDRTHPARQFLDRITQRSLAFTSSSDDGWQRFLATVEDAVAWLDSKVVDAEVFGELMDQLECQWGTQDQLLRGRRESAARALLHAEQRNMLAQKLAIEFANAARVNEVAPFVGDFLKGSWAQVVAEARLSCADGSDDPNGYRAAVDDLLWSVQKTSAERGRKERLIRILPGLVHKLRDGLSQIDYPPELTTRFFDNLIVVHQTMLDESRQPGDGSKNIDVAALLRDGPRAEEEAVVTVLEFPPARSAPAASVPVLAAPVTVAPVVATPVMAAPVPRRTPSPTAAPASAASPSQDSGPVDLDNLFGEQSASAPVPAASRSPWVAGSEAEEAGYQEANSFLLEDSGESLEHAHGHEPIAEPVGAADLRTGTWLELMVNGSWLRVELTWASPHGTLFMFTSLTGSAHSMSRRTLERLRGQGLMKILADRTLMEDALDQGAKAALRNSLDSDA